MLVDCIHQPNALTHEAERRARMAKLRLNKEMREALIAFANTNARSPEFSDAADKAYAKAMVDDHKEDIDLFKKEASSGQNAELKAFAQKTLPTLEEHLRLAQALKANQ